MIPLNKKYKVETEHLYCTGDIHGEFKPMIFDLIWQYKLKDSAIIVVGDCGLGFAYDIDITRIFDWIQRKLQEHNLYLILMRGNHDDPMYFNKESALSKYNNIIICPDFTILNFQEHNILLWGGAISIDKPYRREGSSWWKGEEVVPLDPNFSESIDAVCTHSAPDFCLPYDKHGLDAWAEYDDTLIDRCAIERHNLFKGCEIISKTQDPDYWIYGHFHNHYINYYDMNPTLEEHKFTKFIGLDRYRSTTSDIREFNRETCYQFNRKYGSDLIELWRKK
jgi:hypothetical protein